MNTNVQVLQRRLIALAISLGADGDVGPMTMAAVAKFQADRKLDIQSPGTIGPKTIAENERLAFLLRAQNHPAWRDLTGGYKICHSR